jgi:hypothetical protein
MLDLGLWIPRNENALVGDSEIGPGPERRTACIETLWRISHHEKDRE